MNLGEISRNWAPKNRKEASADVREKMRWLSRKGQTRKSGKGRVAFRVEFFMRMVLIILGHTRSLLVAVSRSTKCSAMCRLPKANSPSTCSQSTHNQAIGGGSPPTLGV